MQIYKNRFKSRIFIPTFYTDQQNYNRRDSIVAIYIFKRHGAMLLGIYCISHIGLDWLRFLYISFANTDVSGLVNRTKAGTKKRTMTEQINSIIDRLETYIKKAEETGNKYDFIDPAYEVTEELDELENNFDAIEPILLLIERSPDIDFGGPGPLGSFLENHYKKGYEELLLRSIERKPTEFTLHLLHRLINDRNNPNFQTYFDQMKKISMSSEYPENIMENAKDSLTYFE